MHADIGSGEQPRRRVGALVLVRNRAGAVLMVKPTYRDGWQLPGGNAHEGESVAAAAARELLEETGLKRVISHVVAFDQVPANPESANPAWGFNFVCDSEIAEDWEVSSAVVPEGAAGELAALKWVPLNRLDMDALPYQARRVRAAVAAVEQGMRLPLHLLGVPNNSPM